MARVQTADVKKIIATELVDLSVFIQTATVQVDEIAALGTLSAAVLKEIERWLAAHYAAMRVRQDVKVTMGDASHTYAGKTGMGLQSTRYGQQAVLLDTSGTLANAGRRQASMTYMGASAVDGVMET